MSDGKIIAGLCLKVPLCAEDVSSLFSYTEQIRAEGFQAGAASRDAYIEQLELALLQVRKAICGDIHNTDDLLDLIASRDAEVAELVRFIKEVAVSTSDHTTTDVIDEALAKVRKP